LNVTELRFYISTALIVLFPILVISGIALYLAPHGPAIVWGINKDAWESLHTVAGFLFAALVGVHIIVNWKMYRSEAKIALK